MTTQALAVSPRRRRRLAGPYLLIAPAVVLIAAFIAYPVGTVVYYSFFQYSASKPWATRFIGLENYRVMLFEDPKFWETLGITAAWVVAEVSLQLVFGLALALILNRAFRGRGLARALMFAPWAISGVLATQIWLLIYNPSTGIADVLTQLGAQSQFAPLASAAGAFWGAVLAEVWRGIPFFAILILADMQSIPREMYEAADVDGANRFQQFAFITLPYLRDAIIITTLLRAVWEFNNVDLIYTLTGGGPAGATTTLPLYVVEEAVGSRNFGYGSALTIAGFLILLVFSILYLQFGRASRREAKA
ncbi:MAG TPA: sugar ABC transporter permease [Rhodoglobus sp.]|nr:sugar ABC transporter permease [Rhodoglobus sp.]